MHSRSSWRPPPRRTETRDPCRGPLRTAAGPEQVLSSVETLRPPARAGPADPSTAALAGGRSDRVPAADATAGEAASFCRASFTAEILSVPLLPSRLGYDAINLLLRDRWAIFVDCLRDFRLSLEASRGGGAVGEGGGDGGPDASGGKGGRRGGRTPGDVRVPASPVMCCSTEAFLLGNLAACGTKHFSFDGAGDVSSAGGAARDLSEFLRTLTSLLELKVTICCTAQWRTLSGVHLTRVEILSMLAR